MEEEKDNWFQKHWILTVLIIVGCLLFLLFISLLINSQIKNKLTAKYPMNLALSSSDLPSNFVFDKDYSGYKDKSYFIKSSNKNWELALLRNFTAGYYNSFYYQDPNSESQFKIIQSSISVYSLDGAKDGVNDEIAAYTKNNLSSFDIPTIGDVSSGYYIYKLNNLGERISEYDISFVKDNVYARVTIIQSGSTNLSKDAIKYAKIIEGKITNPPELTNDYRSSQPPEEFPLVSVSDEQLMQEYTSNEISANDKYKDKTILVSGTIYEVGQDWLGGYHIMLREQYDYNGVQCGFKNKDELMNLYKGEYIIFKGKVLGFSSGIVLVDDCSIAN